MWIVANFRIKMKTNNQYSIFNFQFFVFLFIFLFSFCDISYSQKLTFCESVDNTTGQPKSASTSFLMPAQGGTLDMLVTLPSGINTNFITYDIFQLDEDKKENFENSIKQKVEPDYTWLKKEITFPKAGIYNVYVYDDKDKLLCAGRVTIRIK